ncbi:MAG: ribosome small subunit-dependent GTPase A [Candidatus Hatepunaea meridiana]|nr:ribosome small subunit-dependent GTPase A [Candidatus Hatepunaea meridiana]
MNITLLGWNSFFQEEFEGFSGGQGFIPARIARQNKHNYNVLCEKGALTAEVSGSFSYLAEASVDFPTVGDWVVINAIEDDNKAIIHKLLPRKNSFSRKAAGIETEAQVLASNIDTVFVVAGLDRDFNPRRIERYMTLIRNSGAEPVILLNKADLCSDPSARVSEIEKVAQDVPVYYLSATCDDDISQINNLIPTGKTGAMLGSSGTGKSTIINRLLGEDILATSETSGAVGKGRHTTTWRELILLPSGGIVIDTPGLREIQLWADEEDLSITFDDIEEIAAKCRFRNCKHKSEPGCAIIQAIEEEILDYRRVQNYHKMKREIRFLEARKEQRYMISKSKGKALSRFIRQRMKLKY